MEKVKLPTKIKVVATVLIVMGCFLNFVFPPMSGYSGSGYLFLVFGFSCIFFGILLLLRIKWAWYGAMASVVIISFGFLSIIHSLVENLFIIFLFVALSLIFLTWLFLDHKKYLEVASLKISPKRKKINILIVVGLSILFSLCFVSLVSRSQDMEDRMKERYRQASIHANLKTVQAQAEIYYDNNEQYYTKNSTSCDVGMFTDPTIKDALTVAIEWGDGMSVCSVTEGGQAWAVSVPFDDGSGSFCVDSAGIATSTTINPATGLCSE